MRNTPEGRVVDAVLSYLELRKVFAWRNNSGASVVGEGAARRFVRYGLVGSSDILGILADGRFLAIECKAAKGKATSAQEAFLDRIEGLGGVAILARGIDAVERAINAAGKGERLAWRSSE